MCILIPLLFCLKIASICYILGWREYMLLVKSDYDHLSSAESNLFSQEIWKLRCHTKSKFLCGSMRTMLCQQRITRSEENGPAQGLPRGCGTRWRALEGYSSWIIGKSNFVIRLELFYCSLNQYKSLSLHSPSSLVNAEAHQSPFLVTL
jgi:hypothetical protein